MPLLLLSSWQPTNTGHRKGEWQRSQCNHPKQARVRRSPNLLSMLNRGTCLLGSPSPCGRDRGSQLVREDNLSPILRPTPTAPVASCFSAKEAKTTRDPPV